MKIRIIKETIQKSGDEWVVKSKKGKTLGTHKSKEKAQKQLAAIEANKNEQQLEEISSVGGGGVQGYAGTPLGDEEENKKFNESEEEASKLKGKKLTEMFSSSTQTGGIRISIVSAEKEHAGHAERAQHQGLANVMKEDDDKTKPMNNLPQRNAKPQNPVDPVVGYLDNNGYTFKRKLGEGQYGVVVLATKKDEYGGHNFAIKILKTSQGAAAATREVRNYQQISDARDGDKQIAKHFPEIFDIFEDEGLTFIVMEVLEPLHAELKGIFSGVEQLMHRQRPMSAAEWPISKFDKDKDVSKRVEQMLSDPQHLESLVQKVKKSLGNFSAAFGEKPGPEVQKDIDIAMQARTFINFFPAKQDKTKLNDLTYKFQDEILDYIGSAAKTYMAIFDDLKHSPYSILFVTLMCKKVVDILKKHSQHPDNPDDSYDEKEGVKANAEYVLQNFLEEFQKLYRFSTSLKGGYEPGDFGKEGGRLTDAESIYQAIMKLQEKTGLFARDLHDGNAMRRPEGDIVIVDVGMFKTGDEIKQMKKKKGIRENRIRIRLKR